MLAMLLVMTLQNVEQALDPPLEGLPPPEAYIHPHDQRRAYSRDPYNFPCSKVDRSGQSATVSSVPTDECYKMLPPQRMRGIWIDQFEGSQFLPGVRSLSHNRPKSDPRYWLNVTRVTLPFGRPTDTTRIVRIEFIGRRTQYRAPSGHFGMFDYEIIVDKLVSAEVIGE